VYITLRILTATVSLLSCTTPFDRSIPPETSDRPATLVHTSAGATVELGPERSRPHVLETHAGDSIVRVFGSTVCSGTPLTGTKLVVTAAHCVLDEDGAIADHTTVRRDDVDYFPVSIIVNPHYHTSPSPLLDAAVLVMDQDIPGPSATLADRLPTEGLVTVAGLQPLDTDGSLLRGTRSDNRPSPRGFEHGIIKIQAAPAGCVHPASDVEITPHHVNMPCGLIQGASGGGLFVERNGDVRLAGIISTVAHDLSYNGLVPLSALRQLLQHPARYTHDVTASDDIPPRNVRS
jgi:hypothetical protein